MHNTFLIRCCIDRIAIRRPNAPNIRMRTCRSARVHAHALVIGGQHCSIQQKNHSTHIHSTRVLKGVRLGKMVVKMAIVQLLQKYDFHPTGADKELEFDNFAVTLQVRGGINLRVTKREQ